MTDRTKLYLKKGLIFSRFLGRCALVTTLLCAIIPFDGAAFAAEKNYSQNPSHLNTLNFFNDTAFFGIESLERCPEFFLFSQGTTSQHLLITHAPFSLHLQHHERMRFAPHQSRAPPLA